MFNSTMISEIQIKSLRYHFQKSKQIELDTNAGEYVGDGKLQALADGVCTAMVTFQRILSEIK